MTNTSRETRWFQVTREQFERMQIGKRFRMDGRVAKVVSRSEGNGRMSTGWTSTSYMVRVEFVPDRVPMNAREYARS
jgi:hypothetical protein